MASQAATAARTIKTPFRLVSLTSPRDRWRPAARRLIARTVYAEVPPRVEYELTPMGRTMIEPAVTLAEWAVGHIPEIEASHQAYDSRGD